MMQTAQSAVRMAHTIANGWIAVDGAKAVAETGVIAIVAFPFDNGDQESLVGATAPQNASASQRWGYSTG